MPGFNFICPYCKIHKAASNTRFTNWISVQYHARLCKKNTHEYFIDTEYGPIHYSELDGISLIEVKKKYPSFKDKKITGLRRQFRSKGINVNNFQINWTNEQIIQCIKDFSIKYGYLPQYRDFQGNINGYPQAQTACKHFGTWNKAIEAAGFLPKINSGFGIATIALDGMEYRSREEAYFVDNFLYQKYAYNYEPLYPNMHYIYDWHLIKEDIYIELTAGLLPERIEEKKLINNDLGRKCLFILTKDIHKSDFSLEKLILELD